MLGHIIFLGLFYTVLAVIAITVFASVARAAFDFRTRRAETICWKATFQDLPAAERACRHAFTGELPNRACDRAFDCRECETHAALLARQPSDAAAPSTRPDVLGLDFPFDRFYHRGHAWARPEPDGTVTVGLDALATRLVAAPDSLNLPPAGSRVEVNGTAWRLRKRGTDVRVLSPLAGEVVATGGPHEGWYLKVRPDGGKLDDRHLLRGGEIRPWILREMARLQAALAPPSPSPTLADGGVLVDDIAAACPSANWNTVCAEIFLQS